MKLHRHQEALLHLLEKRNGDLEDLSLRDIGEEIGVEDRPQVIAHHLHQLENKGYIRRAVPNKRIFEVLQEPAKGVMYIDLYRTTAQCGPNGLLGDDMVVDQIPVSSKTFGITDPSEYFFIKARGDSMEPTIHEEDLVLVRKQDDIDNGQMAVVVHNGMPKIKRIMKFNGKYFLTSANPKYELEEVVEGDDEFRICGRVKGVLKVH
jgi:repressor LexA